MTVGSLFSGIGGFDLGLERAGYEISWQVEIDPYCRRVLAQHWPAIPCHADIRTIDWRDIPTVDLICGGFPCQPFSTASRGRRAASSLWPEMFRAIAIIKPTWVIVENVPGAANLVLEQVATDLEGVGYEIGTLEIPACAVGLDHWRPRYWILGYADGYRESRLSVNAEVARVSRGHYFNGRTRASDGVSHRMDRLRAIGNAIVPQIAEALGRMILEAHHGAINDQ